MAEQTISVKHILRNDTMANWDAADPVLGKGETVVVEHGGRRRFKIGDGARAFQALPFQDEEAAEIAVGTEEPDGEQVLWVDPNGETEAFGVASFHGRTGAVIPDAGDYTADMIAFSDGQTFQQKYDAGELTGPQGPSGAGEAGKDATINGVNALTLEVTGGLSGVQSGSTYAIDGSGLFPKKAIVTLTANGWSSGKRQTKTVNGVLEDDTNQLISVSPAPASMETAIQCCVYPSGTAKDTLTFACKTIPSTDLAFYVTLQNAAYI